MDTTSIILKTDSRGRVRVPPQRREELLLEFERSGLPATEFAQLAGVRYQTFATWVQKQKSALPRKGRRPAQGCCVLPRWCPPPHRLPLGGCVWCCRGASIELAESSQVGLAARLIKALA